MALTSSAVLLACVLLLTAFAGSASRSSVRLEKIAREFTVPTGGSCEFDACGLTTGWKVPITTPADQAEVDLFVSVSFTYQISEGDRGLATARLLLDGDTRATPLTPGSFPLVSTAGKQTSGSLSWFREGVPANGRSYQVTFSVSPRRGDTNETHSAFARRGVIVVERFQP